MCMTVLWKNNRKAEIRKKQNSWRQVKHAQTETERDTYGQRGTGKDGDRQRKTEIDRQSRTKRVRVRDRDREGFTEID